MTHFIRQSPKDRSINIVKMSTMRHLNLGEIKVTLLRSSSILFSFNTQLDLTRFLCLSTFKIKKKNNSLKKSSLNNKSFKNCLLRFDRKKSNVRLWAYEILLAHAVAIHVPTFFRQIKGHSYIFGRVCILASKIWHFFKGQNRLCTSL